MAAQQIAQLQYAVAELEAENAALRAELAAAYETAETTARRQLARIEELMAQLAAAQSKIDALMLEHCPEEMTPEQLAEWGANQVPAEPLAYLIEDSNGDGKAIRAKDIDKASLNRLIAVTVPQLGPICPAPAPEGMVLDVDWLSNVIRAANGENKLGAGALAEKIVEAIAKAEKEAGK